MASTNLGTNITSVSPTSTKPLARRTHLPFSEQLVISGDELI